MTKTKTDNHALEQLKANARLEAKLEIANDALTAKSLIAQEAEAGLQVVNRAAAEQVKVIANAVAEALKTSGTQGSGDHDLVIKLGEKMDGIKEDIKELKDGTSLKIAKLELDVAAQLVMINMLKESKKTTAVLLTIGSTLLGILLWMVAYHVTKQM